MVALFSHRCVAMADARDSVTSKAFDDVAVRVGLWPARSAIALLAAAVHLGSAPSASAQGMAQGATLGPASTGVGSQFEMVFWQSVDSGTDPALYEAYLSKYPEGTFAQVARVKSEKLRHIMTASSVPVPPPPSQMTSAPAPATDTAPALASTLTLASAPIPAKRPLAVTTTSAPGRRSVPPTPETSSRTASGTGTNLTPVVRSGLGQSSPGQSDPVPFVTPAVPSEPASETENSAALRRLLGALGDSQRMALPGPALLAVPVGTPAPMPAAPESAGLTAPSVALAASSVATPGAAGLATLAAGGAAVTDAAARSANTGQAGREHPIAVGPLPAGFALPARPVLSAVPGLTLPGSFCSAEARNAFHDSTYVTAVETAKRNNDATIAYMHQLQDLYDRNQLSGDINPMNALASEARAYGPMAAAAFAAQSALVNAFQALMAVPIIACDAQR